MDKFSAKVVDVDNFTSNIEEETFTLDISEDDSYESVIEDEDTIIGHLDVAPVEVVINEHDKLINRDLPKQHPISAIDGLDAELMSIKQNVNINDLAIKTLNRNITNKIRTVSQKPSDWQVGEYIFLEKEE